MSASRRPRAPPGRPPPPAALARATPRSRRQRPASRLRRGRRQRSRGSARAAVCCGGGRGGRECGRVPDCRRSRAPVSMATRASAPASTMVTGRAAAGGCLMWRAGARAEGRRARARSAMKPAVQREPQSANHRCTAGVMGSKGRGRTCWLGDFLTSTGQNPLLSKNGGCISSAQACGHWRGSLPAQDRSPHPCMLLGWLADRNELGKGTCAQ